VNQHGPAFISKRQKDILFPKYRGKVLEGEVAEAAEENLSLERKLYQRNMFSELKEWCPGHLWAPGCYHGSVGQGLDVVEKYSSGQKGYDEIEAARGVGEKTGVMPVAVISEEKAKTHKTGYMTLYKKLFEA
jgi:hypothetical protein